jgi:geranylgeranyl diphosphate synthase type I
MFALAHLAFYRLRNTSVPDGIVLDALRLFDETCRSLTEGQYLDMDFEGRGDVTVPDYFQMIAGKTGALLSACPQIGAMVAGASQAQTALYGVFGAELGRAFQLQDDILGIWGCESLTGKSTAGDILSKKKSLPIIHASTHPETGRRMSDLYAGPPFAERDVPAILTLLEESGARPYVERQIQASVSNARSALRTLNSQSDPSFLALLEELLDSLVGRVS